jgi:hypothetical protein
MTNDKSIYVFSYYANEKHLEYTRHATTEEYKIDFSDNNFNINITETNSLIENRYCLNLKSAKYIIEGSMTQNEVKEAMIHHHPYAHPWKHLQFKLSGGNKVIRINLEPLDEKDYEKCIKGFLFISQELILQEQEENNIKIGLKDYFFDPKIEELASFKKYLLRKIEMAYVEGKVLSDLKKCITSKELEELKKEKKLLPFLN